MLSGGPGQADREEGKKSYDGAPHARPHLHVMGGRPSASGVFERMSGGPALTNHDQRRRYTPVPQTCARLMFALKEVRACAWGGQPREAVPRQRREVPDDQCSTAPRSALA